MGGDLQKICLRVNMNEGCSFLDKKTVPAGTCTLKSISSPRISDHLWREGYALRALKPVDTAKEWGEGAEWGSTFMSGMCDWNPAINIPSESGCVVGCNMQGLMDAARGCACES